MSLLATRKGYLPTSIVYSITPLDHTSAACKW
jgi:hypothetical protein